ncbi:hypothetical protein STEG23_014507, partial [Scotinomys teguina]
KHGNTLSVVIVQQNFELTFALECFACERRGQQPPSCGQERRRACADPLAKD